MTAWLTAIGTILISSSVALYLERPNGESPGLSHWLTLSLSLTFFVLAGIKAWRDDVSKNRTSRDGVSKNFMGKGSARTGKGGSRAGKT